MSLRVESIDELPLVTEHLHDRWFDINAVAYDHDQKTLTVPYWSNPSWRYPRDPATRAPLPFDQRLVIHEVSRYSVDDSEDIGIYSFNDIKYADGVLTLRADPHLSMKIIVERVSIVLDDTPS